MPEKELLKAARKLFYKIKVVPAATAAECDYYINYFNQYPNRGSYAEFYKKALTKRYEIYLNSFSLEYCDPVTLYTPEQLQTYINYELQIRELNNNCLWNKADELMLQQADYITSLKAV